MAVKQHPDPVVQGVLDASKGQLVFDLLYTIPPEVARAGYETLRATVIWVSEQTGRMIPKEVQETLRWLRDHVGPDEARIAALKQYRLASSQAPSAASTFQGRPLPSV